jgi:Ni,Fe-hydrogenase I cytochrome b subunit
MDSYSAFFIGMAGAFCIYAMLYRDTRIKKVIENPWTNLRVFIFDLLLFMFCGGLFSLYAVSPSSGIGAFVAGASWQGMVGSVFKGVENKREGEYKK